MRSDEKKHSKSREAGWEEQQHLNPAVKRGAAGAPGWRRLPTSAWHVRCQGRWGRWGRWLSPSGITDSGVCPGQSQGWRGMSPPRTTLLVFAWLNHARTVGGELIAGGKSRPRLVCMCPWRHMYIYLCHTGPCYPSLQRFYCLCLRVPIFQELPVNLT